MSSSFQRKLDLLDHIPRYPQKISTRQLLNRLESDGHEYLMIRKVQRDLESLEKLGMFGLEVDKRSKPYGWSINLNWKKLNISLMDANSALAFSTLKEVANELLPVSTLDDLSAYFTKAQTILASEKSPLISHWKRSVALISSNNPVFLPMPDKLALSEIKQAIFHKKQINADLKRYLVANQNPLWKRYRKINPLGLVQRENIMTLVCSFGSFHQKVYKFPIAFIKNVEVTDDKCRPPTDYDFEIIKQSYFSSNSTSNEIALCLLIRKDSPFILSNGQFNQDQTITETDQVEMVKLNATVSDTPKLKAFLRGMGNTIEVLEPLYLREYFKELALSLLQKYR
ncbi:helix-turn-helix transcriptional regulator [Colwellia hornerae]|uniref:WYL domain-containing protein n=1 Tax=Colwellia hornerae TaxID=89402 RepID=A0A5C6Q894_9GAMM|nr:WYL domain-containing protein [Colwellia hornerae]TWX50217.1 WYL domain-containing protein [Colwellia hornerae]TWX56114.1 WYL domain-containing protein [Colwellia hornerae]TWX65136.1 WYL domain-containing protein [Colwellia hornerae]